MLQILAVACGVFHFLSGLRQRGFGCTPCAMRRCDGCRIAFAERVQQSPMPARIQQAAIVVLAMNFDQICDNFQEQRSRAGLIVDKGHNASLNRSEARSVGEAGVSKSSSRWWR